MTTPEERAVIKAALAWTRKETPERATDLRVAAQRLRVSRRPVEGPEVIPCMVRAEHSAVMFCHLPKGHEGSVPEPLFPGYGGGFTEHEGVAANNNGVRRFRVWTVIES